LKTEVKMDDRTIPSDKYSDISDSLIYYAILNSRYSGKRIGGGNKSDWIAADYEKNGMLNQREALELRQVLMCSDDLVSRLLDWEQRQRELCKRRIER
jgi:hypothetical protein